ncbi:MAG: hypothetical protein R2874_01625 [Desulfobacterales bacterium]
MGKETAAVMVAMAGGMTRAELLPNPVDVARRNWIIDELEALPERPVNQVLLFQKSWLKQAMALYGL